MNRTTIIAGFIGALVIALGGVYLLKNRRAQAKPRLVIVNVLDKTEFDDCHIKGSINIPFDEVDKLAADLDKDTEVIFYCSGYQCTASGYAVKRFKELGFTHVAAYEAGMADWFQQGLPVEGACTQAYLRMKNEPGEPESTDSDVISTEALKNKIKRELAVSITS